MTKPARAASVAAWLGVIAMLVHDMNALWLEPTYLGFVYLQLTVVWSVALGIFLQRPVAA